MKRLGALLTSLHLALSGCATELPAERPTGPVEVRASVEQAEVTPGRPFFLTVEVDRREDVEFELPGLGSKIEGLVVMDERTQPVERAGGRVVSTTLFKLKAPLTGTYLIPGVEAPWKTDDLQVGTAGTGPILIEATRKPGEEGAGELDLKDIKGVAAPDPDWRPIVALGGAVALLLLILALLLRRRRQRTREEEVLPAHEQALLELHQLTHSGLTREHDQGPFAYALSGILRRYLEARFAFPAWKMTTQEVVRSMPRELASRRKLEASIRAVLEASDEVKFAGEPVPVERLRLWASDAAKVVRETIPVPRNPDEDAA